MNFNLKATCGNCPFLKVGAIHLSPGRLDGIIDDLRRNDYHTFQCHKTTSDAGWVDDDGGDDEASYRPQGKESACMGAAAYMLKLGRTSVLTRLAVMTGKLAYATLEALYPRIIDPPEKTL